MLMGSSNVTEPRQKQRRIWQVLKLDTCGRRFRVHVSLRAGLPRPEMHAHDFFATGMKTKQNEFGCEVVPFPHLRGSAFVRANCVYLHLAIWAVRTWWTRPTNSHLGVSTLKSAHLGDIVGSPASAGNQVVSHCGQTHSSSLRHIDEHLPQDLYLAALYLQPSPV